MSRQKLFLHKSSEPSLSNPQLYTQPNITQTPIVTSTKSASHHFAQSSNTPKHDKKSYQKSYTNFREYVRSNLQTSKDHLQRKFPQQYPQNLPESTYKYDYIKKSQVLKDLPRDRGIFEPVKADGRIEMISTQKHDFTGLTTRIHHVKQPRPQSAYSAFSGKSTYATTFINWNQADATEPITNIHSTVMKDMPFAGRTQYMEQYQGMISPPAQSFQKRSIFKSPLNPPNMPIEKESTMMNHFKGLKTETVTQKTPLSRTNLLSFSYQGLYKTNYQKDFTNKIQEEMDNYKDEFEQV